MIKNLAVVGSGKGGVGKSTVAVNLAASLQLSGARVGLLDADIYGPSVPGMLGVTDQPKLRDQRLLPLEAFGLKLISIGLLAGADKAMVWRGPLADRATEQMLGDVGCGQHDYLEVDLPPGPGGSSFTIAQSSALPRSALLSTTRDA